MARLHTSFVLGYHGCDRSVGERILSGEIAPAQSDRDYDWLGPGVYFWESDPQRAFEWAAEKKARGDYDAPFMVGAAIDLGNCLDLMARDNLDLLARAHASLKDMHERDEKLDPMPENRRGPDKLLRYLDCAVIRHLHYVMEDAGLPRFDTVRGLFSEGELAYPGSGFHRKTHIQIAVRNTDSIKGFFRVPPTAFE
ncbi:MAG: hypothetical protein HQL41_11795 [Alphaproteobacteria bacterium]|nr:hypothetical protein [Alphaproteobacteria bacterium]